MFEIFNGWDYFWSGIGLITILIPAVVGILIIVLLVKLIQGKKVKPIEEDSSIKILKERLAKGEIDEEEYNRKMELLKK